MWSALSRVGQLLGLVSVEPQVDLDSIAAVLDAEDVTDGDGGEGDLHTVAEQDGVLCQHRAGVVVALHDTHGYVNTPGESESAQLYFKRKDGPDTLKVGDRVVYLAFKISEHSSWVVSKILYIDGESWDKTEDQEDVDLDRLVVKEECQTAYKNVIAKVTGRDGRNVLAGNLQFCIDSVRADFIPVEGDWLVLQSLLQTEEAADTLLAVERVTALRSQQRDGHVSHWSADISQGIVDSEVVFGKDACELGYLPRVGDKVRVYCIESEQGQLTWRALRVVPTSGAEAESSHDPRALAALLQDKQGIAISEDTNFGIINIGKETQITIQVKNEGEAAHTLLSVEIKYPDSQFQLVQPLVQPRTIHPCTKIQFEFKVKGRFVGRSTEVVVFKFEGFEIGRLLAVDVQSSALATSLSDLRSHSRQKQKLEPITAQKLLATRNGFILPGVRPLKPAKFVPVSLGRFTIPEKLISLALGSEPSKKISEVLDRLVDGYKCLGEPLAMENYIARWDLLIHLEELENMVNIARYNTNAALHRVQDYLSLEIPGLAERRPSLMVGDRVVARETWNQDNGWTSGTKDVGYEGYIHKVLSNQILIKFSPTFHDSCHGVYAISFEGNRTSFRRQHQAVHVASRNLSGDWLFPARVSYKPPQITIVGEEDHVNAAQISTNVEVVEELSEVEFENKADIELVKSNTDCETDSIPDLSSNNVNVQDESNSEIPVFIADLTSTVQKAKTDTSNCFKNENQDVNSIDLIGVDKNIDNVLMNIENNFKNDTNNKDTSSSQVSGKRVKSKVSDMFEKAVLKEEKHIKISPPRVPVVARFLRNGNNSPSIQKSPNEVKNMLQQLAVLSKNEKVQVNSTGMKTLEEIEKSILFNSVNILDGIKPLPDKEEDKLDDQTNSSLGQLKENSDIQCINLSNNQTPLSVKKEQTGSSNKSVNNEKSYKEKAEKVLKDNRNEITKASRKQDNIEWNSNIELKIGNIKEATDTIPKLKRRRIKWFNPVLNHYQKEAVRNILQGKARPLPYVIFGPPGTGKTITLVEAILQIYFLIPESRLLIGAPSNSAADLVCERLLDWGLLAPGDLLRLMGFHYAEQGQVSERLRPYCGTADIKARDDYQDVQSIVTEGVVNISRHAIGRHRITVGTCNTLGVLYQMGFPRGHFTHVLVDEAGQATEPEILIPLAFLHSSYGQVVLAGDPLQLGPVVLSKVAQHLGLGESLLSRMLLHTPYCRDLTGHPATDGYNPHLLTRLVYNYRSLPEILQLSNHMFYDSVLVPQVCEVNSKEAQVVSSLQSVLPPRPDRLPPALVFHGVRGTNCQSVDSPSWHNPHEAVQATMYLQALYAAGLTPDQCGIITPYQAQALKIRQMLESLEIPAPKVGSVEEFQGQERMAIIVSTVRSSSHLIEKDLRHTIGFVASPRRLNVAVTRARAVLVIIGNPHLLARDHYWRTVLLYCVRNSAYTGCNQPDLAT